MIPKMYYVYPFFMGFTGLSNLVISIDSISAENFYVFWKRLIGLYNFAVGQKLVGHSSRSALVTFDPTLEV
jgi:hypothetical protein